MTDKPALPPNAADVAAAVANVDPNPSEPAFDAAYAATLAINTHPQNQPAGLFERFFMANTSQPAIAAALTAAAEQPAKRIKTKPNFVRTSRTRPRTPFRNIIRYELRHEHVQDHIQPSEHGPIVTPLFRRRHAFLHATKGWRVYARVPAAMGR